MEKRYGEIEYPVLKEKIYYKKYENGFEAYVIPKNGFSMKYACIGTHFGSVHNRYVSDGKTHGIPDGVAHFLEHKLFEQEDVNVFQKFAEYGANPNAYTSFNKTVYLFSCTDNFDENLDILLNYVQKPYFTEENVEKEKGIINQEIGMIGDSSDRALYFNLLKALYKNNNVRLEIAGSVESIAPITPELLYDCYNAFYHPSNMIFVAVGDVDVEKTFEKIENTWGSIDADSSTLAQKVFVVEPNEVYKENVVEHMDVPTDKFMAGFKDFPPVVRGNEALKHQISMEILLQMLFGKSTPLYNKLYGENLINNTFEYEYIMDEDYAYSAFGGESNDIYRALEIISEEIERCRTSGLDRSMFERIKKAKKGRFIKALDNVEFIASEFMELCMKDCLIFDYYDLYDRIDFDYITNVFLDHFRQEAMSVSRIVK